MKCESCHLECPLRVIYLRVVAKIEESEAVQISKMPEVAGHIKDNTDRALDLVNKIFKAIERPEGCVLGEDSN